MASAPYIGLDYFVEEDADLFFGRDVERKRIIGNLRASRLTLLYAPSGVGKSSLLRAGVCARLRELTLSSMAKGGSHRWAPVVFSAWQDDPTASLIAGLESTVRLTLRDGSERELRRDTLEHAIEDAAAAGCTPLVILDQFEDHLLRDADEGAALDDELARCINRRDLRASFLISIRDDAYSLIGNRFKPRIPNLYANYLHLDFLRGAAAREAIVAPLTTYNAQLEPGAPRREVEDELVDAVLEQVRLGRVGDDAGGRPDAAAAGDRVETAYLQLVMRRVWEEETAAGSPLLRLETLERLGGAGTIVRAHLDDVMAGMPEPQRDAAAVAFRFLVTSGGRKIALSSAELSEFSDLSEDVLRPALERLEHERVLRALPSPDPDAAGRHEIYHDVLAPAILNWRRRYLDERAHAEIERRLARARDRARALEVRNRRLAAAVIALAVITITMGAYLLNPEPLRKLELSTIDLRFRLRPARPPPSSVALVAIDSRTLAAEQRADQLTRAQYAELLSRVAAASPKAIAVDVAFDLPAAGTQRLATAIRAARRPIVLGFATFNVEEGSSGKPRIVPNVLSGALARQPCDRGQRAVCFGYLGLAVDPDGAVRRLEYQTPTSGGTSSSPPLSPFAAAAARTAGVDLRALPTSPRRAWQDQTDRTAFIDFRGGTGKVRSVSAIDILQGRASPAALRGKIVVIGLTTGQDRQRTPVSGAMPGPELHAEAIDTLLRGAPLRDVPTLIDLALVVLLALVPPIAVLRLGWGRRAAALIAAAGVLFVVAAMLAFLAGRVVSVVIPLAALLLATAATVAGAVAQSRRRAPLAPLRNQPGAPPAGDPS